MSFLTFSPESLETQALGFASAAAVVAVSSGKTSPDETALYGRLAAGTACPHELAEHYRTCAALLQGQADALERRALELERPARHLHAVPSPSEPGGT